MFDKLFNFNGLFGKLGPGMCRVSASGAIAVHTSNGYKTYNVKTGKLVNVSNFCFDVGDEMFFSVPTNKVSVGKIILVNRQPRCVIEVKRNAITVLNYENNTIETIVPERHVFMGNTYFYGCIMSPFANMLGGKGGGMQQVLKMAMMSKMFGLGNSDGKSNGGFGDMGSLMMMSMLGGKDNMFNGMFDGMFDDADDMTAGLMSADDDEDEGDDPDDKPAAPAKEAK